ncbi:hypothetical protein [[Mycoplasma] testudinis]|uniref:hypothetical protein n=1 Tax=[Mycoplasma] testudinis TaxID=33924 RepID=UPI0004807E08|nr:hypothetical protein [[Mycoplasma] testudinis]
MQNLANMFGFTRNVVANISNGMGLNIEEAYTTNVTGILNLVLLILMIAGVVLFITIPVQLATANFKRAENQKEKQSFKAFVANDCKGRFIGAVVLICLPVIVIIVLQIAGSALPGQLNLRSVS